MYIKRKFNPIKFEKNYWERILNNDFNFRLIKFSENSVNDHIKIFKKYVETVSLETSYYCNRACNYCPVSQFDRKEKIFMDKKMFRNIITALKRIKFKKRIVLNLYNEPLADKNIYYILKEIKTELEEAIPTIHTNGDYINNYEEFYKLQEAGLKELIITLHIPPNKESTEDLRKVLFFNFLKKIKIDNNIKYQKNLSVDLRIKQLNINIQVSKFNITGKSRGGLVKKLDLKTTRVDPCERPFRELTIYYDGTITPCCEIYYNKEHKNYIIDKINANDKNSIFKIYTSQRLTQWRKELFTYSKKKLPCSTCSHNSLNKKKDFKIRQKILDNLNFQN